MILLIDNYDSFSYNLYQLAGSLDREIKVIRNDEMSVDEILRLAPEHIILSPGPGRPENAGICIEVCKKLAGISKILGVCLGHQAICRAYGAEVTAAKELVHGKRWQIEVDTQCKLFKGLDKIQQVARYHSLAADEYSMPDCLKITAVANSCPVMAVKHNDYEIYGVQFHPESIMTPNGKRMLENFLEE